jgi:hypothetical protein
MVNKNKKKQEQYIKKEENVFSNKRDKEEKRKGDQKGKSKIQKGNIT